MRHDWLSISGEGLRGDGEFHFAQSVVLKGTGQVKSKYKNTHSSLADVDQTHKELQA